MCLPKLQDALADKRAGGHDFTANGTKPSGAFFNALADRRLKQRSASRSSLQISTGTGVQS